MLLAASPTVMFFTPPVPAVQVSVPVRARSNDELHVEYRVVWLDPNLQPIRPEGSWKALRLEPRQPYTVTETASSPAATNYNLQFRWSRP